MQRDLAAANEKKHQAALKAGLNQGGAGGSRGAGAIPRDNNNSRPTTTTGHDPGAGAIGPAPPGASEATSAAASASAAAARGVSQQGVTRGGVQGGGDEVDYGWKPPTGQSGDGRTSLNAKLGY